MPDAAGTKKDGSLVFGSQVVTIKNTADADTIYIVEKFTLSSKSNWLVSKGIAGVPNKQAGMKEVRTASLTLQLADATTKAPKQFAEFTAVESGGASVT